MANKEKQIDQAKAGKSPAQRYRDLFRQKEQILALDAPKALDRILSAREPAALVHTFSEEDLYLLIHDIGKEDALPLLALASDRQLDFIFDMETWEKDRMEVHSVTKWLNLLMQSDPRRFLARFVDEKLELIEFYLNKTIQVLVREHDQDPSDFGPEFFTFDDTFYVRFNEKPTEGAADKEEKKQREEFLSEFLQRLSDDDHVKFQHMLLEAAAVIPAEVEEEAYRLRNVRLAEKGFLPFDEAVGIYQSLTPRDLHEKEPKVLRRPEREDLLLPVPAYAGDMFGAAGLFSAALEVIDATAVLEQLQSEFAGLCNRIIAADQKKIHDRGELRDVVKKACAYINIGLEQLIPVDRRPGVKPAKEAAALITKHPFADIFRVGFGRAQALKWRVEKWRRQSWFERQGLPLGFWGEKWLGVLGGLLIKKPLFFDNYKTGVLYRDFWSAAEIESTEKVLKRIVALDGLLAAMGLEIAPEDHPAAFNCQMLVLTLWARNRLGLSPALEAIDRDAFIPFYEKLWDGSVPRKIVNFARESFLKWAADASGRKLSDIRPELREAFEELFDEIEEEYRQVQSADLARQYLPHFLIKA